MKKLFMFMLMAIILSISGIAQTVITVGQGDNTAGNNRAPIHLWFNYSSSQTLYLASEINSSGYITAVAYKQLASGINSARQVKVYMATTNVSSFASSSDALPVSAFTQVYDGNWQVVTNEWSQIELDEPFYYDGTSNLVIAFEESTGANIGNSKYWLSTTTTGRILYGSNDYTPQTIGTVSSIATGCPDVQLTISPDANFCSSPSGVVVSDITSSSASISWAESEDNPTYYYQIKTASQEWNDEDDPIQASGNEIQFEDLTSNTVYNVRIMADCGDLQSSWRVVTFVTSCSELTETDLPKTWDFETNNTAGTTSYPLPACWTRSTTGNYPYAYNSSTNAHGGTYSLYFYNYYSNSIAALTPISEDLDITTLQLNFYAKISSVNNNVKLQVGVMTNPADASTFELVDETILTTSHDLYEVPFSGYTGQGRYIAFRNVASSSVYNYIYVDDVVLNFAPECTRPSSLVSRDVTETSAVLSWGTTAENSTLSYRLVGATEWTEVEDLVIDSEEGYLLEDLLPASLYEWKVTAICDGAENLESRNIMRFKTLCVNVALPYTEDFESSTTTSSYDWTAANLMCMQAFSSGTGTSGPALYESASFSNSGTRCIRFYGPASVNEVLTLPPFDMTEYPVNTLQVIIHAYTNSTSGAGQGYDIGVMTDPSDTSSFQYITTALIPTANTHLVLTASLENYEGENTGVLAIRRHDVIGNNNLYTDDITIRVTPTCTEPTGLASVAVTSESIDLTWNEEESADYKVYYRPVSVSDYEETTAALSDGVFTIDGLTPQTAYKIYVARVCEDGSESAGDVITVTTACGGLTTLPYTCDFETVGTESNPLPACWTKGSNNATYPYSYSTSTNSYQGARALYFYTANTVAMPPVNTDEIQLNQTQLSFYAKGSSAGYVLQVGVMTDPTNPETFELLSSFNLTSTYALYELPLVSYTGEGAFVAFRNTLSNYIYVDNVVLDEVPSCTRPVTLVATPEQNSVTITWGAAGSDFTVYYKPATASDDEYLSTTDIESDGFAHSVTIDDLLEGTTYNYYVVSSCSDADLSSSVLTFTTTIEPVDLPFSTNFEEGSDVNWMLVDNGAPASWRIGSISDNNVLYLSNTENAVTYTISNENSAAYAQKILNMGETDSIQIAFDVTCGGESSYDYIKVFLLPTSVQLTAGPVSVRNDAADLGAYNSTQYALNFSNYASSSTGGVSSNPYMYNLTDGTVRIEANVANPNPNGQACLVFFWNNDHSGGDGVGATIDNISVSELVCENPAQYTISNITATSATVTIEDDGNDYVLHYKTSDETEWTAVELDGYTAELTDLNPATVYNVGVARLCSGDISLYNPQSFMTECAAISSLPKTWNFDEGLTAGTTSNPLPACWARIIIGTSNYPYAYNSSTNAHSGTRALYWSNSSSYVGSMAILPKIDESLDIAELQLSFYAKLSSVSTATAVALEVGVMTDTTDASTFTTVATIDDLSTSYNIYDISFTNYGGEGRYIAVRNKTVGTSSIYSYTYLDDMTLDYLPDCSRPSSISATAVSSNSATLTWFSTADNFRLYYKTTADGDNAWTTIEDVTLSEDNTYEFTGLSSITNYQVKVEALCENGVDLMSNTYSFLTACADIPEDELPWTENFDALTSDVMPLCWDTLGRYTSFPSATTSHPNSGTRALKFRVLNSTTGQIAILPPFENNLSELQLSFYTRREGASSGSLEIGYITNPTDSSTFVALETITSSGIGDDNYHLYNVGFTGLSENVDATARMAFRYTSSNTSWFWFVDDVTVDIAPDCTIPTALTASNMTTTTADLSWAAPESISDFTISYRAANETELIEVENVSLSEGVYTLEDLSPSTTYLWKVSYVCPTDGGIIETELKSFSTACGLIPNSALPWEEGFESTANAAIPNCWDTIRTNGAFPYVNSTNYRGHLSSKGLEFHAQTYSPAYAILPEFEDELSNLSLVFWTRPESSGNQSGQLEIGYMTDVEDTLTFVALQTISTTDLGGDTSYHRYRINYNEIDLGNATSARIAFRHTPNASNYYWYLDDVRVEEMPNCTEPTQLIASNITSYSADLSWTVVGENDVTVYYKASTETSYTAIENPEMVEGVYTLSDLQPSTTYQWYVVANCDGEVASEVKIFTTTCTFVAEEDLPYTEDFEGYPTSGYPAPDCWNVVMRYSNYPYVYNSSYSAHGGSMCLYFYPYASGTNIVTMPEFETPINQLRASFWLKPGSNTTTYGRMEIGVMTDLSDTSSFTLVQTITASELANSNWTSYNVDFNSIIPEDDATYYITFRCFVNNGYAWYLDDVTVDLAPACPELSVLTASNITATTAELSWGAPENVTEFSLYYKTVSETEFTEVENVSLSDGVYTLEDLSSTTAYQWKVSYVCPEDNTIISSEVKTFETLMEAEDLPYSTDFETGSDVAWRFVSNGAPNTWHIGAPTSTNNILYLSQNTTSVTYANSLSSSYAQKLFNVGDADSIRISFDVTSGGETTYDYMKVLLVPTTATLTAGPSQARGVTGNLGNYQTTQYSMNFSAYASQSTGSVSSNPYMYNLTTDTVHISTSMANPSTNGMAYLVFYWNNDGDSGNGVGVTIDNISVTVSETPEPVQPTVVTNAATSVSQTSAVLNGAITDEGNQTITARGFEWKLATATDYTVVSATGTTMTATLTGLTANTTYTYKAFATTALGTVYGQELTFTTLEEVIYPVVQTLPATSVTQTTATLNGAILSLGNQEIVSRGFKWGLLSNEQTTVEVEGEGTTLTYELTGLTANTTYIYKAFATLANGTTTYGVGIQFTTLAEGTEPCTPVEMTISETVCYGETYTFNGQTYNTTGTYSTVAAGQNGDCDTNYTINLVVLPQNTASETITVCYGETATFNGQTLVAGVNTITVSGQGTDCDTLYTVTLTVLPQNTASETITVCYGETATFNGQTLVAGVNTIIVSGQGTDCDTLYTVTLNVLPQNTASETITVCPGETATFNGQTLVEGVNTITVAGQGTDCDTLYTVTLIVKPVLTENVDATICAGETYEFNGQTYNATGIYTATLVGSNGCDSTVTLNLTVRPANTPINDEVTLNNDELPYTYHGQEFNAFGTYTVTGEDEFGCPQEYTLTLVHNSGINEVGSEFVVTLYPNPTTSNATLLVKGLTEEATIMVTDQAGRVISTTTLALGQETMEVETSTLASGVYYVRIQTANSVRTEKLIKK